ncbi:MAG: hypothetical protein PHS14_00260 [Elusimicrobia bacterium]|nr:hypothetical protein [Elusimicrobiota bacterium]
MSGSTVRYNDDGLKRLGALFNQSPRIVRVGILAGPKMARKHKTEGRAETPTNAEIGALQEFGSFTRGIPPRSFLHKPLRSAKAKKRIIAEAAEGLQRELERGQNVNAPDSFYGKIGAGLVAAVQDAFDASGPGWKPLAKETLLRRRTRKVSPRMGTKPLIDLGELRHSISFKVVGR